MRAGTLRQRVTFQPVTLASDGQGGQTATWPEADWVTRWARVEALRGDETETSAQATATLATVVTIRARDVSVTDRIVYGTRTLEVSSVQDLTGRGRELRCLCVEVAA